MLSCQHDLLLLRWSKPQSNNGGNGIVEDVGSRSAAPHPARASISRVDLYLEICSFVYCPRVPRRIAALRCLTARRHLSTSIITTRINVHNPAPAVDIKSTHSSTGFAVVLDIER